MTEIDRRTRKKNATHRAIATAARELVLERGLDAVTIEEIADAADVSPRTFFNYFACKEEAIVGVEPTMLAALAEEVRERPPAEEPLDAVAAVLVADADELPEAARRWVLRTELMRRYPQLMPRHMAGLVQLEKALATAVADRLGVDPGGDPYPALVVASAIAVIRTTMEWWHDNGQPPDLADLLRDAFAALRSGLVRETATR